MPYLKKGSGPFSILVTEILNFRHCSHRERFAILSNISYAGLWSIFGLKMLPESSGAGRRSDAPILRCRRNSLTAYSSGFRREACEPEHRGWPADTFESKTF